MKNNSLIFPCLLAFIFMAYLKGNGQVLDLSDMKAFEAGRNWQIAGSVSASLTQDYRLESEKGKGVLVNLPTEKHRSNLLTRMEHGDADIELEFMMARHSNSGVYLQGRYEVQLYDSWGKINPTYGDCGGIYQRRRPDGSQFEGHAPLVNACKAPGTWQRLKISFQAPRFDSEGRKTQNAKILFLDLNGYRIHENIELTGPTGGPISGEEAARGPLMIQGDHGPVAFRSIKITQFETFQPSLDDISYTLYTGENLDIANYEFEKASSKKGKMDELLLPDGQGEDGWAVVYEASLSIPEDGYYIPGIQAGGNSILEIDGQTVIPAGWSNVNSGLREGSQVNLAKGVHRIKLTFGKVDNWQPDYLGFYIRGDRMRSVKLHAGVPWVSSFRGDSPVYLDAERPTVSRGFARYRYKGEDRLITRSVSVGHPSGLHYSVDLSTGSVFQIWKGNFLDMSGMWNGRGNAISGPRGPKLVLSNYSLVNSGTIRSLGYDITSSGLPLFRYDWAGNVIEDLISSENGKELRRNISGKIPTGVRLSLLKADAMEEIEEGLYSIDDLDYMIKVESGTFFLQSTENGEFELTAIPEDNKISYSIVW